MRIAAGLALAAACGLAVAACGDGTIKFGGDFDDQPDSLIVRGNVEEQDPDNSAREVVVFVFTDLTAAALAAGPPFERFPRNSDGSLDTTAPENYSDQESRLLDGDDAFRIPDVESGSLTLMFLLDEPEPDGQIDAGDTYAVFVDSDNDLVNVRGGRTVTVPDLEIIYDSDADGGIATTDEDVRQTISGN